MIVPTVVIFYDCTWLDGYINEFTVAKKKQKPPNIVQMLVGPFLTNSDLRVRLSLGIKMRGQVEVLAASPSNKVLS